MFLRYKYFGILTKDKPEENEDQMKYDAFFCFRFLHSYIHRSSSKRNFIRDNLENKQTSDRIRAKTSRNFNSSGVKIRSVLFSCFLVFA